MKIAFVTFLFTLCKPPVKKLFYKIFPFRLGPISICPYLFISITKIHCKNQSSVQLLPICVSIVVSSLLCYTEPTKAYISPHQAWFFRPYISDSFLSEHQKIYAFSTFLSEQEIFISENSCKRRSNESETKQPNCRFGTLVAVSDTAGTANFTGTASSASPAQLQGYSFPYAL